MLETSASETLYADQFTLSTQLVKQNYFDILPCWRSITIFIETYPIEHISSVFLNRESLNYYDRMQYLAR